jgi:hypothetical protein
VTFRNGNTRKRFARSAAGGGTTAMRAATRVSRATPQGGGDPSGHCADARSDVMMQSAIEQAIRAVISS